MKKLLVLSIITFLLLLVSVGCINTPTTPSTGTPTPSPTSQTTVTPQITITPTVTSAIEENGKLIEAEFFKGTKKRDVSVTLEEGDGVILEFDTDLDLDAITQEAEQYIYIFCNRERVRNWHGTIYINEDEPTKLMIKFEAGTNISCSLSNLEVVPVKGMLKVKMGGYVKGIDSTTEHLPEEPIGEHGEVKAKMGEEPSSSEMLHWHEAHNPHPDTTETPHPGMTETPHPGMTETPHPGMTETPEYTPLH